MQSPLTMSEVQFIIDAIEHQRRMDTRDLTQKRQQTIIEPCPFAPALADKSIRIIRGHSEISLSICFKASFETLYSLKLISADNELLSNEEGFNTLNAYVKHPNPCSKMIESFLSEFRIGCFIEARILKNDGAVLEMLFSGLRHIFSLIEIPDIHNLSMTIETGIDLPICTSYAFIKSKAVTDPTLIEEKSSDCLIYMFEGSEKGLLVFGSVDYSKLHQLLLQ